MSKSVPLILPSGRVIYAEVHDDTDGSGWENFNSRSGTKSGFGNVGESFETLRELLEVAAERVHTIGPRAPDAVTLELSFELATGGVVRLLGGDAKGGLKVSLSWTSAAQRDGGPAA